MKKKILSVVVSFLTLLSLSGCASFGKWMKEMVGGDVKKTTKGTSQRAVGKVDTNKKYRRTDHKSLQEESELGAEAGSLWIERGQGSYLFTQNTNRLIGDLVNVEIDGQAKKQIETKVKVIQDLLDRIMAQREEKRLALEKRKDTTPQRAPASNKKGKRGPATTAAPAPAAPKEPDHKFDVKTVPAQITEITKDGSYIVEGDQPFMIGKREYKLVVKGIVRQEDFNDEGISAETLLDPKFDIVTNRSKKR